MSSCLLLSLIITDLVPAETSPRCSFFAAAFAQLRLSLPVLPGAECARSYLLLASRSRWPILVSLSR